MNHLMYADDSCIMAPSPTALQILLDICKDFAVENSIVYNEKKSKCMCFIPSKLSGLHIPKVYLNGKPLDFVSEQKYLGVLLNEKFNDDSDIVRQVKALYTRGNLLVKCFKLCSNGIKAHLFKTYCSSNYCCQLWSNYRRESLKKCIVAYNDIYRSLFGVQRGESISQIYVNNNIDSFKTILRKNIFSFKKRLLSSDNIIVSTIVASVFYNKCSNLTSKWTTLLYL